MRTWRSISSSFAMRGSGMEMNCACPGPSNTTAFISTPVGGVHNASIIAEPGADRLYAVVGLPRNFPMAETALQIDLRDNVLVALAPLAAGTVVHFGHPPASGSCPVSENIPAKHKLALADLEPGDLIRMYGMVVGEV